MCFGRAYVHETKVEVRQGPVFPHVADDVTMYDRGKWELLAFLINVILLLLTLPLCDVVWKNIVRAGHIWRVAFTISLLLFSD